MRPDNAVPDRTLLQRFLLGQLSQAEAEPIERYLEQNPDVGSALAELAQEDTLVGMLRATANRPVADPPELAGLMDHLSKLRPAGGEVTQGSRDDSSIAESPGAGGPLAGLAPPQGPGEIGRLGGYRIEKELGRGGMGVVLAAEDVRLKRKVALKVMKPELAANAGARQRFLREAEACAAVRSDHVVTIYQVGEQGDVPFLAMEYLEGLSLDDGLKKGR